MNASSKTESSRIRAAMKHPVVDADGHIIELMPVLMDYLRQIGGRDMVDALERDVFKPFYDVQTTPAAVRKDRGIQMQGWWALPTKNSLDRITVSLPRLLYERLGEMGIDYSVLYPTFGLIFDTLCFLPSKELRRATLRAYNTYVAELFGDRAYADRMTPVAIIPMYTPQEAIEEMEYAVNTLGLKSVMVHGYARRDVPELARRYPDLKYHADRLDTFGIDSDYDYDPVWAKFQELKLSPSFHSQGYGWGSRRSPTSFTYNHIGQFASAQEALAKSLFLGGVTRRFPDLRFAFLEGGVAWATSLYADLVGHWQKRSTQAVLEYTAPALLDVGLMSRLTEQYGAGRIAGNLDAVKASYAAMLEAPRPDTWDDFEKCGITCVEDIRDLFVDKFFFGCEADDPMNALAFDTRINPLGVRLRPVLGSDIGHFDVLDMTSVLAEAHEMLEKGLCSEAEFRDFVFANPVRLYGQLNRDFFKGTAVEREAAAVLG